MVDQQAERGVIERVGWLRAAVLGANDGIVSTASLIVGVASAAQGRTDILIAGCAALVAGAMSMAAGEYVSVSSQRDTENAALAKERRELDADPGAELEELAALYQARGLDPQLAAEVARQVSAHDALGAHARAELGISEIMSARPVQAAFTSAVTFTVGAALPLVVSQLSPLSMVTPVVAVASIIYLALLGAIGAWAGRAPIWRAVVRVTFWGAVAMAITAGVGALFGVAA